MPPPERDDASSLERARDRLYAPGVPMQDVHTRLASSGDRALPHAWKDESISYAQMPPHARHIRIAWVFFITALVFFLISLALAGYFFYYGGNTVSVDKITVDVEGPTTIAAGDTVPLSLTITNKNAVAIQNATIEMDFPSGTLNADGTMSPYTVYTENLGTLGSGQTITRSIKAIMFGGAGQTIALPVSFSYGTADSNATFVKKSSYNLTVASTPLSLSVDTLSETVSGKPLTLTLTVRSNATVPLNNVMVTAALPFGFSATSSSIPLTNSNFFVGTLLPGATSTITLTGTLTGQDTETRAFNFSIGTTNTPSDQTLAVTYMTQQATVAIAAPFIDSTLSLNGEAVGANTVVSPGKTQSASISYTNTLTTSVTDATVSIQISGSAVDYNSIETENGFYSSSNHTITFSRDTDPSLAVLAPGASGIGSFNFSTLPAGGTDPNIVFTISVSGTRIGQTNVPEQVSASLTNTIKVATTLVLSAFSLHASGPLSNTGPIPPHTNQPTTYTIVWNAQNQGSAVAGGSATAVLPSYVSYTNATSGAGSFSYDPNSHQVTWSTGDLPQGSSAQGEFQVSLTPSTSQQGTAPPLEGPVTFSGYDRFAGVQISATADPVTTETPSDPGYVSTNGTVQ
jgi:hypothetical protein